MTIYEAEKYWREEFRKVKEDLARAEKELNDLRHAPSLAVIQLGGATKDGGAWRPIEMFDENDEETESERRMWAARDSYDMRDGK